ncbi:MAG: Abi family protein [Leucobacter sp.]
MGFDKTFEELPSLVSKLSERGLSIASDDEALNFLSAVGYHRSGGYRYIFREFLPVDEQDPRSKTWRSDDYIKDSSLKDVVAVSQFDRKLREACLQGTLEFESRLKHEISHVLARRDLFAHDSDQHLDTHQCSIPAGDSTKFAKWRESHTSACSDAKFEDAISHHLLKYGKPYPVWAAVEVLSFGALPYLLELMREEDRLEVARAFGVKQSKRLTAWVRLLGDLRNISAHNQRLFNRVMKRDFSMPISSVDRHLLEHMNDESLYEAPEQSSRVYKPIALLAYFLESHSAGSNWARSLATIVKKLPNVQIASETGPTALSAVRHMGFPREWEILPLWS